MGARQETGREGVNPGVTTNVLAFRFRRRRPKTGICGAACAPVAWSEMERTGGAAKDQGSDGLPEQARGSRHILIAEDEPTTREGLARTLRAGGYEVDVVHDGAAALEALGQGSFDLVVTDLRMPGADGIAVLRRAREIAPQTLVLMTTAHASVDTVLEALREGVADYLEKPIRFPDVANRIEQLLDWRDLAWENQVLRRQSSRDARTDSSLVGRSPAIERIRTLIAQVAPTNSTVLITGESGTGKEVVARALHRSSRLSDQLFLPINCGAIPESLLESQLFGHRRGSFTGAVQAQEGLFHRAHGGTILLDEIGDLQASLQVKLLRAIEAREILPIGATTPLAVKVRVIASTNRDLRQAVAEGRFREDLYYRLKVVEIHVPPLRERPEDIPLLVEHLLKRHNTGLRRSYKGVDNHAMSQLTRLPWRGNVRELDHAIEFAMLVGDGEWIHTHDLPLGLAPLEVAATNPDRLTEAVRRFEKAHIETILRRTRNDRREAAKLLEIDLSTLYRKIRDLKIA